MWMCACLCCVRVSVISVCMCVVFLHVCVVCICDVIWYVFVRVYVLHACGVKNFVCGVLNY